MALTGRSVLAFGTRGSQGTGLLDAIEAAGAHPVRVSTDPAQVSAWKAEGLRAVTGDLTDPSSMVDVADVADAAVLHLPFSLYGPASESVVASVVALRTSGVDVAINVGSPVPPEGAPDFQGSRDRAHRLLEVGASVVAPTAYLENHLLPPARARLLEGTLVYPLAAPVGISWISSRDVTRAAVAALASDTRQLHLLAGPEILTFPELAAEFSAGAERDIRFQQVTAAQYADLLRPLVGDQAAAGLEAAYASMPQETNPLMAFDASASWAALGIEPQTAREWASTNLTDPA